MAAVTPHTVRRAVILKMDAVEQTLVVLHVRDLHTDRAAGKTNIPFTILINADLNSEYGWW